MAIGFDTDTDYAERTGIPDGGAGTLTLGGFASFFVGVWNYRPSSGNSYAGTSEGYLIGMLSGAREMKLGYNNNFGAGGASDPLLQVIFNSGGGTLSAQTFAGANFLNEWVYYFLLADATNQTAGYIRLSDLATATTIVRANDNAGSQYTNTLTLGSRAVHDATVFGHYAYGRARDSNTTVANALTYAASNASIGGDWGFWDFDNNADGADTSGNGRTMTLAGTITTETSPTLSGGPPPSNVDRINGILRSALSHRNGIPLTSISHVNGLTI